MNIKYEEAIQFFIENKTCSIKKVAKIYSIDRGKLSKLLKELNLFEDRRIKYTFNKNYFDNIDSDDKAYWLGFLLADGCIKKQQILSFVVTTKDKHILEDFKKSLNSNHLIKDEIKDCNFKKKAKFSKLVISSKYLVNSLKKYGIIQNKTYLTEFNANDLIPNKYINAYIRGIFDGDGWFTNSLHSKSRSKEIGFSGTENVCLGIQKVLKEELGIIANVLPYKSIYRIRISRKDDILKIYTYMYTNKTYYLVRKYNQLKDFAALNETTK